jgi:TetR/AcrR family transcriptional repressor of nem operon
VGVNELCRHAGVKKGSFYHFFPSKQDLLLTAVDELAVWYGREIYDPVAASDLAPLQKIDRIFELLYEYHAKDAADTGQMHGCHFGNLAMELSTQDEEMRQKLAGQFAWGADWFKTALDDAVAKGDLPQIDTSRAALALLAYLEGILLLAKTRNEPELLRQMSPGAELIEQFGTA